MLVLVLYYREVNIVFETEGLDLDIRLFSSCTIHFLCWFSAFGSHFAPLHMRHVKEFPFACWNMVYFYVPFTNYEQCCVIYG